MTVIHVGKEPRLEKSFPDCKYIFLDYTPYMGNNWGGLLLQVSHRVQLGGANLLILEFESLDLINDAEFSALQLQGVQILNVTPVWTSKMITEARHILYYAEQMEQNKRGCSKKELAKKTKSLISAVLNVR